LALKRRRKRVVRRLAFSWAAAELAGAGVLLVEKPLLGAIVIAMTTSLFAQKLFARARA
jgi:hypothetical protein